MTEDYIFQDLTIPNFQFKTDINECLISHENAELNQILSDDGLTDEKRLEYLNYLYFQVEIIWENLDKPSSLIDYILNLYPDSDKENMLFLLQNLQVFITNSPKYKALTNKTQIHVIVDRIVDEENKIAEVLCPEIYGDGVNRTFSRLTSYSNTSEDLKVEINRLLNIRVGCHHIAILKEDDMDNNKLIRHLDIEISRLEKLLEYFPEKKDHSPLQGKNDLMSGETKKSEIIEHKAKPTPVYSVLLIELSKYMTGINANEFKNIIENHTLTPGTPKAVWIGKPVDAYRFVTFIKMDLPTFNKYFSLPNGRKLRHNDRDKLDKGSPIIDILKAHLQK